MSMTDQLLNLIYTEKVREDEGGTYGVYPMGQLVSILRKEPFCKSSSIQLPTSRRN